MFKKVLIANRGEIALRIMRACRDLGIKTVSVYSEADRAAKHVRLSDESVCIGPAAAKDSYLNISRIVTAAEVSGADAIHPGYGFLSENAEFARIVEEHGITFIGPSPQIIDIMGDKGRAKACIKNAGVPVVPGDNTATRSLSDVLRAAKVCGYPAIIKAVAGGGGRGMAVVQSEEEVRTAFPVLQKEAMRAFGSDDVIVEKFIENPRHIELQFVADKHGNAVCLWERECSLQRRNQKVFEEAPSSALTEKEREKIVKTTTSALKKIGYTNVGTVEYLYKNKEFYFIEMNTRLQVEHPVTEMITGVDIVRTQLMVASGYHLEINQKDLALNGVAFEARINAEKPKTFTPTPGKITAFHAPGGYGVRVDTGVYSGVDISPHYDSMIAKLIVHAPNRKEAILRLKRALSEMVVEGRGVETTIPLFQDLLENKDVIEGDYHINWLENFLKNNS
ncbi:MAG: acetyl-CoA carboxylase biotin carboxylase subunit [Alphaproteobacteria bacterium]|nr:acetyl-CoA carboxylase biotin carboxylase subunit [Alphaproteobacteria bacterium]